ncbi:MAG: Rieske (2Fe-2S) protein, partial [Actinomycetota bacterium]|nr:Rieske (2Fe-2S) protein [Actinomycetota bacterium]
MTDWTEAKNWVGVRGDASSATTLPPATYTDIEYFEQERLAIFGGGWCGVAMVDEVAAGKIIVREVAGVSVIITRNQQDQLRGYLNSCSHRGTELVEQDGPIDKVLRCPYHRWTFDLDGTLISTPLLDRDAMDNFNPDDFGLRKVRVDLFANVVWIS